MSMILKPGDNVRRTAHPWDGFEFYLNIFWYLFHKLVLFLGTLYGTIPTGTVFHGTRYLLQIIYVSPVPFRIPLGRKNV
jgi:hypothetical protein